MEGIPRGYENGFTRWSTLSHYYHQPIRYGQGGYTTIRKSNYNNDATAAVAEGDVTAEGGEGVGISTTPTVRFTTHLKVFASYPTGGT
jgi:hypothetical protein